MPPNPDTPLPPFRGTEEHPPPEPAWLAYEEHLGLALKLLRIQFGIRQGDLAASLTVALSQQVSQGYISRIERSKRGVSHRRLALICKHLDCTPSRVIELAESLAANTPRLEASRSADVIQKPDIPITPSKEKPKKKPKEKRMSLN